MTTTTELENWLNGTPTGGPNGDGRYPLTDKNGVVHLTLCPAAQALQTGDDPEEIEVFTIAAQQAAHEAGLSANAAAFSESNATAAAAGADQSETAAAASAAAAETSATTANTRATAASSSASAAAGSASAAATSKTGADTAKTGAETAKTAAETARDKAQAWADNAEDVAVESGKFSARHWAAKAALAVAGYVSSLRKINAGNGLTGGGDLSADRTLTLGTPGTLTGATANAVTTTSHTHNVDLRVAMTDAALSPSPLGVITVGDTNGSTGGFVGWTTINAFHNNSRAGQIQFSPSGGNSIPEMYFRTHHATGGGGGWTGTYKVHHEGNFNPATKQDVLGYTPANAAHSMVAGNGLTGGGTMGASRTLTLGTPGTLTGATTNAVTSTSHTHALSLTYADIGGTIPDAAVASTGSYSFGKLRLTATGDASATSTAHAFQVGSDTGPNIIIDGNEMMARNNGANVNLNFQLDGASASFGGAMSVSGALTVGGNAVWHAGTFNPASVPTQISDLAIIKNNAWLTVDSSSSGGNGVEQGAGISVGENGYKGNASIHLTYTGDGYGHLGMGTVDAVSGIPAKSAIKFFYQSNVADFQATPTVLGSQVWHAGNDGAGSGLDADLLQGREPSYTEAAYSVAMRNGSGDIHTRLFRSTYGDQTTIAGAIAYRTNSASDNYIRFCSNNAAVRGWLDVQPTASPVFTGPVTAKNTATSDSYLNLESGTTYGRIFYRDSDKNFGIYIPNNAGTMATRLRYDGAEWTMEGALTVNNRISAGYDSGVANSINCSGFFRSTGNTGWYNGTHGTGVYSTSTTYLRSYGDKPMYANDFVTPSDIRLKSDVVDLVYKGRLHPVEYTLNKTGEREIGFIAQEVEEQYPLLVGEETEEDGAVYKNLSYNKVAVILSAQINQLEDTIATQAAIIAAMEARLAALESK